MTRYITLLVVFFLALSESFACEVCGCSASSAGLGLVSGFRNHTLGLRWSEASFEGAGEGQDVGAQDAFHTYEFFARYHLSSRWLLAAGLPYRRNVRQASDGDRLSQDGFSDPRLLVGYVLLDQQQLGKSGKLYLEVQAGAKFPLGRYNSDIHQENLPENFNTGYGCFAYLAQANAVLLMGKAGLSWSASAQFNGRSTDDYRFGRQLTSSLLGFYQLQHAGGWLFIPLAGLSVEQIGADRYPTGLSVHGTGGNGGFALAGVNVRYRDWQIAFAARLPAWQSYSDGKVDARTRLTLELSYFF